MFNISCQVSSPVDPKEVHEVYLQQATVVPFFSALKITAAFKK